MVLDGSALLASVAAEHPLRWTQEDGWSLPEESEEGGEGDGGAASTRAAAGSSVAGSRPDAAAKGPRRRERRRRGGGGASNGRDPTAPREAASEDDIDEASPSGRAAEAATAEQQQEDGDLDPPPGFSPRGECSMFSVRKVQSMRRKQHRGLTTRVLLVLQRRVQALAGAPAAAGADAAGRRQQMQAMRPSRTVRLALQMPIDEVAWTIVNLDHDS